MEKRSKSDKSSNKLFKFEINFTHRTIYTFITLAILIIVISFVIAVVPNPGHSTNQIEPGAFLQ